jgi:hypothetical protein
MAGLTPSKEHAYSLDRNLCKLQALWIPGEEETGLIEYPTPNRPPYNP